jgi:L-asparaginase
MTPVLVIHGGAGSKALSTKRQQEVVKSLRSILESCKRRLLQGASALDVVTQAAMLLEDDELYNAGRGSKIQSDGHIRMSAAAMDGSTRRFGGCVNVEGVRNPILIARGLMRKKDRVLSGAGAARFARELGLRFSSPFTAQTLKDYKARKSGKSGTIGAVALDRKGRLAATTSTGGRGFEYPFRVSDCPTVAGNFANRFAAVSATGTGEEIVENAVAASVCRLVEAGWSLKRASEHILKQSRSRGGEFGLIAVDREGQIFARTNTPLLIWGSVQGQTLSALGKKL